MTKSKSIFEIIRQFVTKTIFGLKIPGIIWKIAPNRLYLHPK